MRCVYTHTHTHTHYIVYICTIPVLEKTVALCENMFAHSGHRHVRHGGGLHFLLHVHVAAVSPLYSTVVNNLHLRIRPCDLRETAGREVGSGVEQNEPWNTLVV